ncbi:ornithine cyclodeaminase family protein [Cribrihabitans sp. XS_ASV171]
MRSVPAEEVRRLLPMDEAVEIVREAMISVARGKARLPLRSVMELEGNKKLGVMPGALTDPLVYGVKLLSLFPDNPARGLSSHTGTMILFDPETGAPALAVDADALTAIRTAAATAVATDALARSDARILAVIGTGEQAETHIEALRRVRDLSEIRIAGRTPDRARAFVTRLGDHLPLRAAQSAREAVDGADIVCTVTSSSEVVLCGEWVQPGCHVNAVGASIPTMQEIDRETLMRAETFVDYRPSAFAQAREIIDALAEGAITEAHIRAEIGAVLDGTEKGRSGPEAITLYRSLGIAAQDLACAEAIRRKLSS